LEPLKEERKSSMVEWPYQTTFRRRSLAPRAASTESGRMVFTWTAASAVQRSVVGTPERRRHSRWCRMACPTPLFPTSFSPPP
jgi:hypothetical protein